MLHYFDVYNRDGQWVGCYDYEWQADQVAYEYDGYYLERFEEISLQGLTKHFICVIIIMCQGKGDKTPRSKGAFSPQLLVGKVATERTEVAR